MPNHGPQYGTPLLEWIAPRGEWNSRAYLRAAPLILFPILIVSMIIKTLETGNRAAMFYTFVLLCVFFIFVCIMMNNRAANKFGRVLWPQGNASPYQHDFSFEKSLVMQGRVPEALESYEAHIRLRPTAIDVLLEAAELNAKQGSVTRAIELFRSMRLVEGMRDEQRMYATNRLIDLYLKPGPDQNTERARSELRYLIAHFRNSRAAVSAEAALRRMLQEDAQADDGLGRGDASLQ